MRAALAALVVTTLSRGEVSAQVPADSLAVQARARASYEIDQRPTLDSVQAWYFPKGRTHSKATVVFQAVVDTTGRVDPESITLLSATDSLFVPAARLTFMVAYYQPGRVHGRPVRVLIRQSLSYKPGVGRSCQLPNITPMLPPKC